MLSSRLKGIPISSSTIRRARTASVTDSRGADGASLQQLKWPVSSRNGGRLRFGTAAGIKSESVAGLRRISQGATLARLGRQNEARSAVVAGLALYPSFTVSRYRAVWTATNDNPGYLAAFERVLEGMRMAGVPEQ